jgi:hypothetical protein
MPLPSAAGRRGAMIPPGQLTVPAPRSMAKLGEPPAGLNRETYRVYRRSRRRGLVPAEGARRTPRPASAGGRDRGCRTRTGSGGRGKRPRRPSRTGESQANSDMKVTPGAGACASDSLTAGTRTHADPPAGEDCRQQTARAFAGVGGAVDGQRRLGRQPEGSESWWWSGDRRTGLTSRIKLGRNRCRTRCRAYHRSCWRACGHVRRCHLPQGSVCRPAVPAPRLAMPRCRRAEGDGARD